MSLNLKQLEQLNKSDRLVVLALTLILLLKQTGKLEIAVKTLELMVGEG